MNTLNEVQLLLSESDFSDAVVCENKNLIHQVQMKKILAYFSELYTRAEKFDKNAFCYNKDDISRNIVHNTISIFGNRGAGKTTFLLSALSRISGKYSNVACLKIIDPSIIDCKQHPFINIIALIHQYVEEKINQFVCWNKNNNTDRELTEEYRKIYKKLLKGLTFIDGIGTENVYKEWDDELFISMQGMEKAEASNSLIDIFHKYVFYALRILNKKCFVISFDDIDTNFQKGYEILEVIRKYLTTEQIITILTGDLELYGKLVRKASWNCFDRDFLKKECEYASRDKNEFSNMVNHLENQYLLKILKPELRIHLHTIIEIIKEDNCKIKISFDNSSEKLYTLEECYEKLLRHINLPTNNRRVLSRVLYFMMSLSLRSQIRLLGLYKNCIYNKKEYELEDFRKKLEITNSLNSIFWNDINQKAVNAKKLITPDFFYTVEMQSFLIRNNVLHYSCNFMPYTNDEILNKALMAIGAQFNIQAGRFGYMIFDFWLRISYLQYVIETFEAPDKLETVLKFLEFTSLNENDDLTKSISLAHAYCMKKYSNLYKFHYKTTPGSIIIKGYPEFHNLDKLFTMMFHGTQNEYLQETVFVSVYKILAAVRDLLFYMETDEHGDIIDENEMDSICLLLNKLCQYKFYNEPSDYINLGINEYKMIQSGNDEYVFADFEDEKVMEFATRLFEWKNNFRDKNINVSAQLLQRIFTRFYFSVNNLDMTRKYENLGDKMNAYIVALLNAVLIENAIEGNLSSMDLSSTGDIVRIFKDNLQKYLARKKNESILCNLYEWISQCPVFRIFLNPYIVDIIDNKQIEVNWQLYNYEIDKRKAKRINDEIDNINSIIKIIKEAIEWATNDSDSENTLYYNEYKYNKNIFEIFINKKMDKEDFIERKMELYDKLSFFNNELSLKTTLKNEIQERFRVMYAKFVKDDFKRSDMTTYNVLRSIEIEEPLYEH